MRGYKTKMREWFFEYTYYMIMMVFHLQLFVHVSTSYCHLDEKVLFEKAYPPPADPHKVIQSMESLEEHDVESTSKQ